MTQPTPAALLRLREADVVRFCGLDAAARGLELDSQRAVRQGSRDGARLAGVVEDGGPLRVWWEHPPATPLSAPRWGCERDAPAEAALLCCAHVAALLSAWMRAPADFTAPAQPPSSPTDQPAAEPKRIRQPSLLSDAPITAAPTSLHDLLAAARPRRSGRASSPHPRRGAARARGSRRA